jgi:hypothetical protein
MGDARRRRKKGLALLEKCPNGLFDGIKWLGGFRSCRIYCETCSLLEMAELNVTFLPRNSSRFNLQLKWTLS